MEIYWTWTAEIRGLLVCFFISVNSEQDSHHHLTSLPQAPLRTHRFVYHENHSCSWPRLGSRSLHYKTQNLLFSIQVSHSPDLILLFQSLFPTSEQEPSEFRPGSLLTTNLICLPLPMCSVLNVSHTYRGC